MKNGVKMAAREALHTIMLWCCVTTFFRVHGVVVAFDNMREPSIHDDTVPSNKMSAGSTAAEGLGIGIIIAIAIGSLLACISCVFCCYYCCCRRPPPAHQTVVVAQSAPQAQNTVIVTPGASQPQPQPYPYPQPYPQPQPQAGYNPQPNAMPPPAPYPAEMPPPYPAEMPPYDGQQSSYGYAKM